MQYFYLISLLLVTGLSNPSLHATANKITLHHYKDLSKLLRPSYHFFKAWPPTLFVLAPLIKNIEGKVK